MIKYKIIKEIEKNPNHTQRSLAETLNVSLGKINYIISGFIKIGAIQAKKVRDHYDKIRWGYYLTPKGIKEKMKLTQTYYKILSEDYGKIQKELDELKKEVSDTGGGD
jgi:EPS-associated MarR family transcriptional regulator